MLWLLLACNEYRVEAGEGRLDAPSLVTFEHVVVGSRAVATVSLDNAGIGELTLDAASWSPATDLALTATLQYETVAPGEQGELTITFEPEQVGQGEATLILTSDDPTLPEHTLVVRTDAVHPELDVDPETLWLTAAVGETVEADVDLVARGTGTLRIQALELDAPFMVSGADLPLSLDSGTGVTLTVSVTAESEDPVQADLLIASNDPDQPIAPVRIYLNGTSGEGPPTAEITAPDWGAQHWTTDTVALRGLAVDQGDAPQDLLVAWYQDGSLLGSSVPDDAGRVSLDTTLPAGELELTLRVLDSQGNTAEDHVEIQVFEPEAPSTYIVSGGPSVYDFFTADDDVEIWLDGALVFQDDDGARSSHAPVHFEARPGQSLRIVATDENYCEKALDQLVLHWGTGTQQALNDAECTSACAEDACFDGVYAGPWPNVFIDETHVISIP